MQLIRSTQGPRQRSRSSVQRLRRNQRFLPPGQPPARRCGQVRTKCHGRGHAAAVQTPNSIYQRLRAMAIRSARPSNQNALGLFVMVIKPHCHVVIFTSVRPARRSNLKTRLPFLIAAAGRSPADAAGCSIITSTPMRLSSPARYCSHQATKPSAPAGRLRCEKKQAAGSSGQTARTLSAISSGQAHAPASCPIVVGSLLERTRQETLPQDKAVRTIISAILVTSRGQARAGAAQNHQGSR